MNYQKVKLQMIKEKNFTYNSLKISSSIDVVKEVNKFEKLENESEEKMILICLNTKNQIVNYCEIASGGTNYCMIDPKTIFKSALLSNASKIILVHNHPSGDIKPSQEDLKLTERIKQVCELVEIQLLDHIIIGDEDFKSIMN